MRFRSDQRIPVEKPKFLPYNGSQTTQIWLTMAFEIDELPISMTMDGPDRESDYAGEHAASSTGANTVIGLPAALRSLDVSRVETRVDFVRELAKTLPLNEYNLPIYLYNPAFLDIRPLLEMDRAEAKQSLADGLTNAITNLEYDHGYPTLKNDQPLWSQLPWETRPAFEAFLQYLQQEGARGTHHIVNIEPGLLKEWFHENYWHYRAVAYDSFRAAHHARLREARIFSVQDSHYRKSEAMLQKVYNAFESIPSDKLAEVEPEKLAAMFSKLAKTQQDAVLVGVPKDGAVSPGPSVEVVMRAAAQKQGQIRKVETDNSDFDALLQDPAALEMAQELIIKVNK
jgi:hypothetical protein